MSKEMSFKPLPTSPKMYLFTSDGNRLGRRSDVLLSLESQEKATIPFRLTGAGIILGGASPRSHGNANLRVTLCMTNAMQAALLNLGVMGRNFSGF